MKDGRAASLWENLGQAGLVGGDRPPEVEPITVPWYVRIMTGVAGWIAAALLLAVVPIGMGGMLDNGWSWLMLGGVSCLFAWYLSNRGGPSAFTDQFAFALSVAGQFQILIGLEQLLGWDLRGLGWFLLGLEILLFFAIAGFIHRVWTVVAGGLALLYLIGGLQHSNMLLALTLGAFALVWLNEFRLPGRQDHMQPLGYGLLSVIVILVITGSIDMGGLRSSFVPEQGLVGELLVQPLLGGLAVAALVVVVTLVIVKQQALSYRQGVGMALSGVAALVALTTLWAPGIGAAYLVILIGHALGNRVLLGFGAFGLLSYLSHYYYALELSLLHKSALLAASGLALILVRLAVRQFGLITVEDRQAEAGQADA
jgi:uncharacterized membrane protein